MNEIQHPHPPHNNRSRLLAAASAGAIIVLGLGAFAWLPHPDAEATAAATASHHIQLAANRPPVHTPRMLESGAPFSFADLVERVAPAVVTVTVEEKSKPQELTDEDVPAPFRDFFHQFGGQAPQQEVPHKSIAMGSGFIIDAAGYIVTNNHVVDGGQKITVKLKDGRQFTARLIGTDKATDIALLKIDSKKPLPSVQFSSDRDVRVGDWVIAVGNPFGLSNTVTAGIVSSLGRAIGNGPYTDYIQIDAPINRGNSGGPAFDIEGKVIGMNTMIYSPSGGSVGIGFAIPSSTIHEVVDQLKAHGKVTRGWLGVEIQNFTPEMAASLGNDSMQGAIVANVVPNSPAAKAGFRQGDVVLALNGSAVADSRDLTRRVATLQAGAKATFTVMRDGKKQTLTANIGLRKPPQLAQNNRGANANDGPETAQAMGLGLASITPTLRQMYNVDPGTQGVLITKVDPASDAADKGLEAGDVVISVGNHAVHTPADIQASIKQAKASGRGSVLALVATQNGERFVAIHIDNT
jgi:serine protease Do